MGWQSFSQVSEHAYEYNKHEEVDSKRSKRSTPRKDEGHSKKRCRETQKEHRHDCGIADEMAQKARDRGGHDLVAKMVVPD